MAFEFLKGLLKSGGERVIYQKVTPYNRISVIDDGEKLKLILDSSCNLHSVFSKDTFVTGSYWDLCAVLAISLTGFGDGSDVLMLGFGGGTIARIIKALCPKIKVVGVDIDKEVLFVAKRFFDARADHLVVADFRDFVWSMRRRFSATVVDVFQNATVPTGLFDVRFWQKICDGVEVGFLVNTTSPTHAECLRETLITFPFETRVIKCLRSSNYILVGMRVGQRRAVLRNVLALENELSRKAEKRQISADELISITSVVRHVAGELLGS